jgi:hypothetical protein
MSMMLQRIAAVTILSTLFTAGCSRTTYAPGFSAAEFQSIKVDDDLTLVLDKLGKPVLAVLYSKDPQHHPLPSGEQYELVPPESLEKYANRDFTFIVLQYSIQAHSTSDYWRNNIWVERGKVKKVEREYVTE